MTALAFDFLAPSSPSQVHAKRVPGIASKRLETLDKRLETLSSNDNTDISSQEIAGRDLYSVSSPQTLMRELGDLIAPKQPGKTIYPLLATDLRKYCPNISLRRVRSLYNGEVGRIWSDESFAIRMALSDRRNAKARRDFARAAAEMSKTLAAHGVPLTPDQHRVVVAFSESASA